MTSRAVTPLNSVGYVARAISKLHWIPVFLGVGLLLWATAEQQPDFDNRHLYIRVGLLLAAIGLSFSFDDPSAPTTDHVPSSLGKRRSARSGLALIPWLICLGGLLWAASQGADLVWSPTADSIGDEVPVGRLVLEGATLAAAGLAIASAIAKRLDEEPGKFAAPALLILFVVLWMIPDRWKPFAIPTDSRWDDVASWWWVALVAALAVIISSSWDSRRST